jgi:hypothetical protein
MPKGGHNRRTVQQHRLSNSYRPDRHASRPSAADRGLDPPDHLDPEQCAIWRELAPRYSADPLRLEVLSTVLLAFRRLAQIPQPSATEQRVLRQTASLVSTLASGLRLADGEADTAADDGFDEFDDDPLQKYLGPSRETRGQ